MNMITEEQDYFMQVALKLSKYALNSINGGPYGAIIIKNGEIVGSSGKNIFIDVDPCAHAEVMAIRDACKNLKTLDLSNCQLYSTSEPCPMCLAAIYWAQISKIYYCNDENKMVEIDYKVSKMHGNHQTSEIKLEIC